MSLAVVVVIAVDLDLDVVRVVFVSACKGRSELRCMFLANSKWAALFLSHSFDTSSSSNLLCIF